MALPTSGPLKFSSLSNVFGVPAGPVQFSKYYCGAASGYNSNTGIVASGPLDFNTFHGKANVRLTSLTASGMTQTTMPLSWIGLNMSSLSLTYTPSGGSATTINNITTNATTGSYTLSNLSNNKQYSVVATALDANNNRCLSFSTSASTLATIVFTFPSLTYVSNSTSQLTFSVGAVTVPSGATLTITDANNDYNTTINTKSSAQNVSVNVNPNTTYSSYLKIINLSSTVYTATSYTGSSVSATSVSTIGSVYIDSVSTSSFIIHWGGANSRVSIDGIGNVGGTSYTVTNAGANTYYAYTVRSYNSAGVQGDTASPSVTTLSTIGSVYINNVSTSSFIIYWGGANTTVSIDGIGNVGGTFYTVTNAGANTYYAYTVRSYNSAGVQGDTANTSVTTIALVYVMPSLSPVSGYPTDQKMQFSFAADAGVSYQGQYSTDNINWINAGGTSSPLDFTLSPNTTYYFRLTYSGLPNTYSNPSGFGVTWTYTTQLAQITVFPDGLQFKLLDWASGKYVTYGGSSHQFPVNGDVNSAVTFKAHVRSDIYGGIKSILGYCALEGVGTNGYLRHTYGVCYADPYTANNLDWAWGVGFEYDGLYNVIYIRNPYNSESATLSVDNSNPPILVLASNTAGTLNTSAYRQFAIIKV